MEQRERVRNSNQIFEALGKGGGKGLRRRLWVCTGKL